MVAFNSLLDEILPDLFGIRHELHAHPQLGYQETFASQLVQTTLSQWGISFRNGLAETGVVAWLEPDQCSSNMPAIGLRADLDALPIAEATGLPYASVYPGQMHACGHDGHTTVLLGVAWVLNRIRHKLPRPVKLIFQPAEEFGAGAQRMIEDGALSNHVGGRRVGAMFGLHGSPFMPLGWYASRHGALLAGCSDFAVTVRGTGGHAATPHTATDPLITAAHIVTALQTLVSRNTDPAHPALISVGTFHGGTASNVIPDRVEFTGTLRGASPETCEMLHRRLEDLTRSTAAAFGCTAEVEFSSSYPPVINDDKATAFAFEVAERLCGPERIHRMDAAWLASEDFAFYSRVVPSTFGFYGLIPSDKEKHPMLHTPQFDFTDGAIETGVRLMCEYALHADRVI